MTFWWSEALIKSTRKAISLLFYTSHSWGRPSVHFGLRRSMFWTKEAVIECRSGPATFFSFLVFFFASQFGRLRRVISNERKALTLWRFSNSSKAVRCVQIAKWSERHAHDTAISATDVLTVLTIIVPGSITVLEDEISGTFTLLFLHKHFTW